MKTKLGRYNFLLPMLLSTGCTTIIAPPASVSEAVIKSLVSNNQAESPWRLDSAWQCGGLVGAALRSASVEHVVRQDDNQVYVSASTPALVANETQNNVQVFSVTEITDDKAIERAWRKYCHHQLDMTTEEHELIAHTQIPHIILSHGCNPGSLKK
jgi:hypothetical protein